MKMFQSLIDRSEYADQWEGDCSGRRYQHTVSHPSKPVQTDQLECV